MKHRGYNGVQLILVSRDGNFRNQVAAVALIPVEDYDNYEWFFSRIMDRGFSLRECPVFSDQNLGLISAARTQDICNMFCVRILVVYQIVASLVFLRQSVSPFARIHDLSHLLQYFLVFDLEGERVMCSSLSLICTTSTYSTPSYFHVEKLYSNFWGDLLI